MRYNYYEQTLSKTYFLTIEKLHLVFKIFFLKFIFSFFLHSLP